MLSLIVAVAFCTTPTFTQYVPPQTPAYPVPGITWVPDGGLPWVVCTGESVCDPGTNELQMLFTAHAATTMNTIPATTVTQFNGLPPLSLKNTWEQNNTVAAGQAHYVVTDIVFETTNYGYMSVVEGYGATCTANSDGSGGTGNTVYGPVLVFGQFILPMRTQVNADVGMNLCCSMNTAVFTSNASFIANFVGVCQVNGYVSSYNLRQ
jgi:hypothetical protein